MKTFDVVGRLAYCNYSLSVGDCFSGAGAWRVVGPQRGCNTIHAAINCFWEIKMGLRRTYLSAVVLKRLR